MTYKHCWIDVIMFDFRLGEHQDRSVMAMV